MHADIAIRAFQAGERLATKQACRRIWYLRTSPRCLVQKTLDTLPGSGYWTRKSLGIEVELPVLPTAPDSVIEITPATPKPRQPKSPNKEFTKDKAAKKTRTEHHPLLFGVEGHLRKSREVKDGEFLRPYKRLLPDVICSEPALPRALRIVNAPYLALDEQGYRVHIAH